jgi:Trypsin
MTQHSPRTGRCKALAGVAAGLILFLGACAAPPPAEPPPPPTADPDARPPASPPAAKAPALDGRLQVDAREYPWSAIGRVNLAGQGFCNGILIGANYVLTQAHCLYATREGRWWQPFELHFVAGYQHETFLANAPVASFTVAPGYNPAGGASLANLTNNWAVLVLGEAIGNETGWLGIEWDSDRLVGALALGGSVTSLGAGYRSDRPHAFNLHFGCSPERDSLARLCEATPSERALPKFALIGGELRVLADRYLRSPDQGQYLARATAGSLSATAPGRSVAPARGSPARGQPTETVALLLGGLGYDVGGGLDAAIAAYRRDHGLPPGSAPDIGLLTSLITTAQSGTPPR